MNPRALAFISVGAAGFLAQTGVIAILVAAAHCPVAIATPAGVEAALLTNFFCHERWTWRDRLNREPRWRRMGRFHVANGMTSLVGNTLLTVLLANRFGLNPIAANAVAVGLLSVMNFVAANRWVFVMDREKRSNHQVPTAVTRMPAASRPARIRSASTSAPSVSL